MSMYQSFLKMCDCKPTGIIFKDNVAVCRWCRKPYEQGGQINYEDEHFQKPIEEKEVLFTTEDGHSIDKGWMGTVWVVFTEETTSFSTWKPIQMAFPFDKAGDRKVFYLRNSAEEWILMNKPCISVNEICALGNIHENYKSKLIELAKSKINQ